MKKSLIALAIFVSLNANGMNPNLGAEQSTTREDAARIHPIEMTTVERQNPLQVANNEENISYAYLNSLTDEELSRKFTRLYYTYGILRGAGVIISCLGLALNGYVAGDLLITKNEEDEAEKEARGIVKEALEGNNKLGGDLCIVAAVINGVSIINTYFMNMTFKKIRQVEEILEARRSNQV